MKKKIIALGMAFVSMSFIMGFDNKTDLPEVSKEGMETSITNTVVIRDTMAYSKNQETEVAHNTPNLDGAENSEWVKSLLGGISTDGYIMKTSSTKELTLKDLSSQREPMLSYILGEIYARHGYVFKEPKYQKYFESKKWYRPAKDNSSITLNAVEQYNAELLQFLIDNERQFEYYVSRGEKISKKDIYEANKEIRLDLNGDGKDEVITYKLTPQGTSWSTGMLSINNAKLKMEGTLIKEFAIVDINPKDSYKEILISYQGSNLQYSTLYYIFKNNRIIEIGSTQGLVNNGIKINGDGTFTARTGAGGSFIHNWPYSQKYYLDVNHKIAEMTQEFYEDNTPIFLQQPFEFYKSKDIKSGKFRVEKGEIVTVIASDLNEWGKIQTSSGETGWFKVIDNSLGDFIEFDNGQRVYDVFAMYRNPF